MTMDFFVSYNKADLRWARWIAWYLEAAGHTTLFQEWDFRAGSNWVEEMDKGTRECDRTLAVLSPNYLSAEYVRPEWYAAFARDPRGIEKSLVPVRVRECRPEGLLAQIVYLDLVGLAEAEAKTALLSGVSKDRPKPVAAPTFPGAVSTATGKAPPFPPTVQTIFHVPHLQNHNFTGREKELEHLRAALTSDRPAPATQALHGLGGMGKTQLALEYCYRHQYDYDLVWWLGAETSVTMSTGFQELAARLGFQMDKVPDPREAIQWAQLWLESHDSWLLVFDDVAGREEIKEFRPKRGRGHLIMTSRNPHWKGIANPTQVEPLPPGKAVEFFLTRTGQEDATAAGELADELGYLPLALEQAAAYMETRGLAIRSYLDQFRSYQLPVLDSGEKPEGYHSTVATTWNISIDQVKQEKPEAVDLMYLMALLAADDIPRDLFREGAEHLPEPLRSVAADPAPMRLDAAIAALKRYSLIEAQDDALSVHRLVQMVIREQLGQDRQIWAGAAVGLLAEVYRFHQNDPGTWPRSKRLLPHVLVAAERADAAQVGQEVTADLLNSVGRNLLSLARFPEARRSLEGACSIYEAVFHPHDGRIAACLSNLGLVLRDLGDFSGARRNLERALEIGEAVYGPDHPEVAASLNNLGRVLQDSGDLAGAKGPLERALAIFVAAYGPDHPQVATCLNNFGLVLQDLWDLAGAKENFERALAIFAAAYGPDHPSVAMCLSNLGTVLRDLGDLAGAKENFERGLGIDEAMHGLDHPNVAIRLNNLGAVLQDLGDLAGAKENFEHALAIFAAAYGVDHPDVATGHLNVGYVLAQTGQHEDARRHWKRALDIRTKVFGADHWKTQAARDKLESLGSDQS